MSTSSHCFINPSIVPIFDILQHSEISGAIKKASLDFVVFKFSNFFVSFLESFTEKILESEIEIKTMSEQANGGVL